MVKVQDLAGEVSGEFPLTSSAEDLLKEAININPNQTQAGGHMFEIKLLRCLYAMPRKGAVALK